jgi:hypothetical protein
MPGELELMCIKCNCTILCSCTPPLLKSSAKCNLAVATEATATGDLKTFGFCSAWKMSQILYRKAAQKMTSSNKYLQNIDVIMAGCLKKVLPQADNGKDYPTTWIDTIATATVPRIDIVCVTGGKKYLIRNSIGLEGSNISGGK